MDYFIEKRIEACKREIEDLERTKSVMVNETARKAIGKYIRTLSLEIMTLERLEEEEE